MLNQGSVKYFPNSKLEKFNILRCNQKQQNTENESLVKTKAVIHAGIKSLLGFCYILGPASAYFRKWDDEVLHRVRAHFWGRKTKCKCQMLIRLEKTLDQLKRGGEAAQRGGTASLWCIPTIISERFNDSLWMKERQTKERSREPRGWGRREWRRVEMKKKKQWNSRREVPF